MSNPNKHPHKVLRYTLGTLMLFLANILYIAADWTVNQFPDLDFASIIFHLKVPLEGSNNTVFTEIILKCLLLAPIPAIIGLVLALNMRNPNDFVLRFYKLKFRIPISFWKRWYLFFCSVFLVISVVFNSNLIGINDYLETQFRATTLYEDYYQNPASVNITFPEKKRNLIYIFMESMENTYASTDYAGGYEYDNFIPEMVDLQLNNTNFTASANRLSGGFSPACTTWTMAAMVAHTAGIPLNIPIDGNAMDTRSTFLPGAYSIGEILADAGYRQEFFIGSEAEFGGRKLYMTQHGNYTIKDYNYAIDTGLIPPDYLEFWGYEDEKLYSFAKDELTRIAASDEPFNFTMLTADTHFIGGYVCDLCDTKYGDDQYANVISCASRQLLDFVSWIQEQPFYENTTIVITGDHPTMDNAYIAETCGDISEYQRTVYTTILNGACEYTLDYDRTFTTFDLYPTTLASLGASIEGDRLALGTNLYADIPTLAEQLGLEEFNRQISGTSKYYTKHLLYGE